jgi:hypothetical protein
MQGACELHQLSLIKTKLSLSHIERFAEASCNPGTITTISTDGLIMN